MDACTTVFLFYCVAQQGISYFSIRRWICRKLDRFPPNTAVKACHLFIVLSHPSSGKLLCQGETMRLFFSSVCGSPPLTRLRQAEMRLHALKCFDILEQRLWRKTITLKRGGIASRIGQHDSSMTFSARHPPVGGTSSSPVTSCCAHMH